MVATTDRYATQVGISVLQGGGNAVDAAVAVSFALAVVNPEAGNLGGSGFLLARMADGLTAALDYRGVAPRAATPHMFVDADGALTERSQIGPSAAAVPGSVMGLWEAHRELGSLPWGALVEPAVSLAGGFRVLERLVRAYPHHIVEGLRRFPESARVFLPGGGVPRPGDIFRQPELALALERIRDRGPDGFYRGQTAELIVAALQRDGGVMDLADLASYEVRRRQALAFPYRGHEILAMPPSSSGGVALAETSHILSAFDLGGLAWHGPEHVHLLAEAWRRAFADRNHYLADPDFADVPVLQLTSRAYGLWRSLGIGPAASSSAGVGPGLAAFREGGGPPGSRWHSRLAAPHREGSHTTHVSIVDAAGNAVAVTTTLNTWFGSKFVAAGTGVLLNNEMDDFTTRAGTPNHFGLLQGTANAIAPGKRMLSAMAPTIVLDGAGRLSMVLGAPGGASIITTVFQVISNVLDHRMSLAEAVVAPRVHHQHLPDRIDAEPSGLPQDVAAALRTMGHDVEERTEPWGDVQAIRVEQDGTLEGVADARRGGTALAL